jgi:uncharacterized protein GlcG (DUF336 family)
MSWRGVASCAFDAARTGYVRPIPFKGESAMSKTALQCVGVVALTVMTALASAQERPPYGAPVNVAMAKKIAAGVIAECQKNSWRVAVAVVDTHGTLVYYEKIDDTQTVSAQIAVDKARAAAMYRRPTRAFVDAIAKSGPAIMTLPGVVASPGGEPIMIGGRVVGGVGVSGVTGDQDEQCAKAGLSGL